MTVEFAPVPAFDQESSAAVRSRRAVLPVGLLGILGPTLDRLAGIRGTTELPAHPEFRMAVFAADHGVAADGISARPADGTARIAADLAGGIGPVAGLARSAGVGVTVFDIGVDAAADPDLSTTAVDVSRRVRGRSERIDVHDAMTADEVVQAISAGRDVADAMVDAGADLLVGAVCGVGVSTPTAVLAAAVTGMEPVDATTRGSGIDDAAWIRKAAIVRDALYRARLAGTDAVTLLRTAGGVDLAALAGFIAQAAVRRTPVLIDDVPSVLSAVLAHRLAPGSDQALLVASAAPERTHERLLELLGAAPLLNLGITDGPGTAALLAVPLLHAAAELVAAGPDSAGRSESAIDTWDAGLL